MSEETKIGRTIGASDEVSLPFFQSYINDKICNEFQTTRLNFTNTLHL